MGATGSAAPTQATLIAGSDGTNLRGVKTDTSGQVYIANVPGAAADPRGLTERMFAKAPQSGYHLYIDGANADGYTYIAEARTGRGRSPIRSWPRSRRSSASCGPNEGQRIS